MRLNRPLDGGRLEVGHRLRLSDQPRLLIGLDNKDNVIILYNMGYRMHSETAKGYFGSNRGDSNS